jgi:para-aminobenzoate synthetase
MLVPRRILFIDAYDSFTNNIVGLLETTLAVQVSVIHHDCPMKDLKALLRDFDAVVIGPGPGHPENPKDIGLISQLWELDEADLLPIFGVCLGFQSLASAHGATIQQLPRPRHGIVTRVTHQNSDIFTDTGKFYATNYHSLTVRLPSSVEGTLMPLAWDFDDEVNGAIVLALRHATKPFWGVQFHPESECTTTDAARRMITNWWAQADAWISLHHRSVSHDVKHIARLLSNPARINGNEKSSSTVETIYINGTCDTIDPLHESLGGKGCRRPSLLWERYAASKVAPTRLYETLREGGDAVVLLDSQDHPKGRFSILGLVHSQSSPMLTYRVADRALRYGTGSDIASFPTRTLESIEQVWPLLQEALDNNKPDQQYLPDEIPFWGGWMGYISYEAGLETIDVNLHESCAASQAPDINMVFVYRSIVIDHQSSSAVVQTLLPNDESWVKEIGAKIIEISSCPKEQDSDDLELKGSLQLSQILKPSELEYCAKVALCQETLAVGDSYELCLTDESKLLSPSTLDPWKLYKKLRLQNAAPYGSFLQLCGVTVVGSSPERFLQWDRQGHLEFRPIKGTVKKGPNITRADAHAILNSSKERAENLMIVDLIRHDLSGVVGAANCHVSQLMVIEEYETVYQLVSAIEGHLPVDKSGIDVLRVSLPPGSMTGAPKKRSCEVLRDLEKRPRGVYSGILGFMDVGGAGDFSVVIRTAFRRGPNDVWRIGAGGAVTIQSDVTSEFHEMETKASSVLGAMHPALIVTT